MVQRPPVLTVTRVTCDVCAAEIRSNGYDDVEVNARIGEVFPESDCRTVHEIDCCAKCFIARVVPTLEREFGIKFRQRCAEDHTSDAYSVKEE